MGSGRWNDDDWKGYVKTSGVDTKSDRDIFRSTASTVKNSAVDPHGLTFRESVDSVDNPLSTPIIFGIDVTGSMGHLAGALVRKGLNTLVTEIYDRKPVTDPHVLCAAIGDAEAGDRMPFQITQFEADVKILPQIETLYLEGGGGGNRYESYALAWYFAVYHTKTDSFTKRGKKGYIFTVGDELPTPYLLASDINRVFGSCKFQGDRINAVDLLTLVSREWEVFHLFVEESEHARRNNGIFEAWKDLLGQRALSLSDHTKMAEVIVSAMQVNEGADKVHVAKSWDGSTSLVVTRAIGGLVAANEDNGIVSL